LASHLLRADTNERVEIRHDLFRDALPDIREALRLFAGLAKTNSRVKRAFVHIIISPSRSVNDSELREIITTVEREHNIPKSVPRVAVEHHKGNRAKHFHLVFPIVDPDSARAIKSHNNFERDELISRTLELRFGEKAVPGPRLAENIAELRRRGATAEANLLADSAATSKGGRISGNDRRQAERLGIDPEAFSARVFDIFENSGRDLLPFQRMLADQGLALAHGRTAILVVDDATGFELALGRLLRRNAKAAGRPLDLGERDISETFRELRSRDEEREKGGQRAMASSLKALEMELGIAIFESLVDGDLAQIEELREKRKQRRLKEAEQRRLEFNKTLKERRAAIAEAYRQRDEIRRRRVDRAFRFARIFASPEMRDLAFALAAGGVLLAGGSFITALVAGGFLMGCLPSYAAAHMHADDAKVERETDVAATKAEVEDAYRTVKLESKTKEAGFDFALIDKQDRALVGFYAIFLMRASSNAVAAGYLAEAAASALGPDLSLSIRTLVDTGSDRQINLVRSWYLNIPKTRRPWILSASLRRHGQFGPADRLAESLRQRTQKISGREIGD
jgi:hypothetical protein